ncbi:MAG: DUF4115 domain-containing protein [Chloroflexi bacterium]|nr:DUF4115 domain-containing protein [Chloroflexota bacterium]
MATTIGEQLKKARAERNLSLEQVAFQTHIRLRYLQALEDNQFEVLPSEVQGRGFLRLYADFLGISAQPLLDQWAGKPAPEPEEVIRAAEAQEAEPLPQEDLAEEPPAEPSYSSPPAAEEPVLSESQQLFIEIGQKLKKQREALSLSLADVERYTHIRERYLQSLEAGRIDELPSTVQGRGMLNNYAHFLELDTEELMLHLANGLQTRRLEQVTETTPEKRPFARRVAKIAPGWRRFLTPDLMIGGSIIVFLFLFAIWSAARISAMRNAETDTTDLPPSSLLLDTASGTATLSESETPVDTVISTQLPGVEESAVADTTEVTPVVDNAPLQVYVVAHQRAWMRVISDKQTVFEGRVTPGNAYQFSGNDQVELLTGNAAALQVLFNQNDLGTLGITGQVVGLIFTSAGVVTPTPIFTATPTPTSAPTITPMPSPTVPTVTITPYIP